MIETHEIHWLAIGEAKEKILATGASCGCISKNATWATGKLTVEEGVDTVVQVLQMAARYTGWVMLMRPNGRALMTKDITAAELGFFAPELSPSELQEKLRKIHDRDIENALILSKHKIPMSF